jgi:hypothetical protein
LGTRSWRARSATWALRLTTPWRWRSRRRFDALTASARGRSPARELVRGPTQSPRVHACRCDRTVSTRPAITLKKHQGPGALPAP